MPSQSENERGRGVESAPSNVPRWEGSMPESITDSEQRKAWEVLARVRVGRTVAVEELDRANAGVQRWNRELVETASQARDAGMGAQEIADALGISRQFLYDLVARVRKAEEGMGADNAR